MTISKIGVLILGSRDLARSVAFYRDKLELPLKQESPGFAFLDAGSVTLALSEPLAKASTNLVGATEVVFPVAGVKEAHLALQARGVEFFKEPRVVAGSMWAASFRDPDGHVLSLFGAE